VSGVAVKDGRVAVADLPGMIEDDDLGDKVLGASGRLVLRVAGNVAAAQLLNRDVLDVEADVVAGDGFGQGLVVHLHGLDLGREGGWGEGHDHARLQDSGFNATDGHRTDSADFVHVLQNIAQNSLTFLPAPVYCSITR
jgi:hypothetical protein